MFMMAVTNPHLNTISGDDRNCYLSQEKPCTGIPNVFCCGLVLAAVAINQCRASLRLTAFSARTKIMNNLFYLLEPFLRREYNRINKHRKKARDRGLPATLTLVEWLRICRLFDYKCAYRHENGCKGRFETIEHLVPLSLGGGTTAQNCVPCCEACNQANSRATEPVAKVRRKLGAAGLLKSV